MDKTGGLRKVVLVVDDDRPVGELIAAAIRDEPGFEAIYVQTPARALDTLKQVTPDVMVVDVQLPGMSGLELYDRVQQDPRTKTVPVLFETASAPERAADFRRRGIAAYVGKPFDLWELVRYVIRLASGAAAA